MEFWFRRKYNLPPTDPRFLDASLEEMAAEYWAYQYLENPATEEVEDDDFDKDAVLAEIERQAEAGDEWEEVELGDDGQDPG